MSISLIVAVSQNGVIGKNNQLPWRLPEDLKRFKQLTMAHPIVMGRKTFESIGKPLPGRTNIVVTHQKEFACCLPAGQAGGAVTAGSLEEALRISEEAAEVFVIGGATLFEQAMPLADKIYLTLIHQDFEGDTFFKWDKTGWKETAREDHLSDPLPHSFINYSRAT